MSHPEGMQTFAARLATFEAPKTKGKKRISTKNKKNTSLWPLDSPSTEELAQAGFHFTPTSSSSDNVTCFTCQKSLDEWEEGDNAFEEHLQFAPECAWAVTMAVERGIVPKDDEHDPLSEYFMEMRTTTFGTSWPHESKRGWTCKVQKLVEAGWHYNPMPGEDDQTKCAYCNLAISCWEPKDKPFEEHKRRSPECSFFRLAQMHKKTRKSRKSRASKASRASTVSTVTAAYEPGNGLEESADIDDSIMTTATDVTTASVATTATRKSTRSKKPTARAARGKKKQQEEQAEDEAMDEFDEPAEPQQDLQISSPVIEKKTRGKKRSSAAMLEDDQPQQQDEPEPAPKKRATRGRSTTARRKVEPEPEPEPELEPLSEKRTEAAIETELQPEHESSVQEVTMMETEEEPRSLEMPKRGPKARKTRGSSTSRSASGAAARKASTTRKASSRQVSNASITSKAPPIPILNDAEIEAQLEADLDRPLSDEEQPDAPVEALPSIDTESPQKQQTAKHPSRISTSKTSQEKPKPKPKIFSSDHDDPEEDELAQMEVSYARPAVLPEKQFANRYEEKVEDADLSGHEPELDVAPKPKPKKGPKKASTAGKAKRGRPPKKAAPKVETPEPEQEESILETQHPEPRFSSSFEEVPSTLEEPASSPQEDTKRASKAPKTSRTVKAPAATKKGKGKKASAVLTKTELPMEPSSTTLAAAKEPTPLPSPVLETSPERRAPPTPASAPGAFPSPTPSPQSSNAENEPPSSRPSQTRPPLATLTPNQKTIRVPLGSAAPSTPTHSIRRDPAEDGSSTPQWALNSAFPWRAIDIENVFLPSPETKRTKWLAPPEKASSLPLEASRDVKDKGKKANASAAAKDKQDKIVLMKGLLTSPEKKMTVEDWIRWNAERGEERLKAECERVVGKFESEGIRAMKALEGLVVEEWA